MTNQPASDAPFPEHENDTARLDTSTFDDAGFTKTAAEPESPSPLVGTMVWGLVLAALAVLTIVARQAGLVLDLGQILIWLLLGAGVAMVVGGAASLARRKK
ncbi:hypothetical protein [Arthrobacter sp. 35W]|uniref:hypothetical protein n=1 Tax=Arthrobacter sp. 35W TaxID=1132441 RepID=UPI00054D8038|nr:hypothetical protein [Arthrobacter sp. 35W]